MQMELGTLAQWFGAAMTLLAVLTALFKDEVLRCWRKPKLGIRILLAPPDCHKTTINFQHFNPTFTNASADCYYLRLWVENTGNSRADRVQVLASKLSRRNADGLFKEDSNFVPMNLRWSYGQQRTPEPEIFAEGISPKMGKHCDLAHIVDPNVRCNLGEDLSTVPAGETILALDLEARLNIPTHLLSPGVYRLELRVAAANCFPTTKILELTLTGKWSLNQAQMFSDGLGVRTIS